MVDDYKTYEQVTEGLRKAMTLEDLNLSAKDNQTLEGFYEKCSQEFWKLDESHPKETGYFFLNESEIEYVTESGKTYVADHCALEEEEVRVLELIRINHPSKTLLRPVQGDLNYMDHDEITYQANEHEFDELLEDVMQSVSSKMAEHEDEPGSEIGNVGKMETVVMVEQGCQTEPIPSEENLFKPILLTKNKVVTPYKVINNNKNSQNSSDVDIRDELAKIRKELKVALMAPMQMKNRMFSAYKNAKNILEFVNDVAKRLKRVEIAVEKSKTEFEVAGTAAFSLFKGANKSAKEVLEKIQQKTRAQTNNVELALKRMETNFKRWNENDYDSDDEPDPQHGACGRELQRTALAAKVAGPRDRCFKCDDRGHWTNDCTRTDGLKLCFDCNEFMNSDHIKYNCPWKRYRNHGIGRGHGLLRSRGFFRGGRGSFRGSRGGISAQGGEGGKRKSETLEKRGLNNKRGKITYNATTRGNFQYQSNSQSKGGFKNNNSTNQGTNQ